MTFRNAKVGDVLSPLKIERITREQLALFAGASGDHQPVHIDIDAARAKGREDVFAHGMLSMAYLGRILTDFAPQERIRSYKARFVAITPIYAEPTCTGRITAIENGLATIELEMHLADGKLVVRGEAIISIL